MSIGQINKYSLLSVLGKGNFGVVYHALDNALNQEKAIKVLDVEDPSNFVQKLYEAQILNICKHKHIVEINEANIFQAYGVPKVIIDMEYIPGGSLESLMAKRFISVVEARSLFIDTLFGLEHAHMNRILHRDIKPANVMITENCAKLSDFGLATMIDPRGIASLGGYRTHAAPEMLTQGITTVSTDLFAAGVTLFRVVNNINNWRLIVEDIIDLDSVLRSGLLVSQIGFKKFVPNQLIRILRKATNKDSSKRFHSASEFRMALEKLTPNIDWNPISVSVWEGKNAEGNLIRVEIKSIRNHFALEVSKKGRKILKECRDFDTKPNAEAAMFEYIRNTTFNRR